MGGGHGDERKEVSGRLYSAVKGMDRIILEDSGEITLKSDHNLIWCEVQVDWRKK